MSVVQARLSKSDTENEGTPFLELKSAGVVYPNGTLALEPTDLTFRDREVTVLLGPSGAGKSSLLRSLNMLVPLSKGRIETTRHGVLDTPAKVRAHRRETAMVYQQHQLIGRRSALKNVLTGRLGRHSTFGTLLPFSKAENELALTCLDRVDLFDKALTRCDSLSGGQQQRVGIARALAQQPQLILADEPVASLDPASSARVLGLLRDICRQEAIPAIISLHQLDYAREYGDRIIGLSRGRVVFDGPPSALTPTALKEVYGPS